MHPIVPEILSEAKGLSAGVCIAGILIGIAIWLFGWRWHRFWTVLAVTLGGGVYGLSTGQATGTQMIGLALILAIAAGLMALEIAKIFAFAAAGTVCWMAAQTLFPKGNELWVIFFGGGLAGILFYRLWMMLLTSYIGTLILSHSILLLVAEMSKFDAAPWAAENSSLLTVAVFLVAALGLGAQGAQVRWSVDREERFSRKRRRRHTKEDGIPADVQALRDAFAK